MEGKEKNKRGGPRIGAGRKPQNLMDKIFLIRPDQAEWLNKQGNHSKTIRDLIDRAMNEDGTLSQNLSLNIRPEISLGLDNQIPEKGDGRTNRRKRPVNPPGDMPPE